MLQEKTEDWAGSLLWNACSELPALGPLKDALQLHFPFHKECVGGWGVWGVRCEVCWDHPRMIWDLSCSSGCPKLEGKISLSFLYIPRHISVYIHLSSVQFNHSVVSESLRPHESQHARPPCPSPTPRVYPNSCPLSGWCHLAISSSVVPFSSCPQSLPASESFLMSQPFAWGGQSIGVSASASVLPVYTPEWTGWISLQSKGLSRVFSNTTVQKHQFFGAQLFSQSNSHIHTWSLEKP